MNSKKNHTFYQRLARWYWCGKNRRNSLQKGNTDKQQTFLIAPDYLPKHFLEWYRFNTRLQTDLEQRIHLIIPNGQTSFNQILKREPDFLYSSTFDAEQLIRNGTYLPVAKPSNHSDEVIIFTRAKSSIRRFEDLRAGHTMAAIPNRDIEMMGLRLLEALKLDKQTLDWQVQDYVQSVARMVRDGSADAGLMLAEMFRDLEDDTRRHFHILIESSLDAVTHLFLLHRRHHAQLSTLQDLLRHCITRKEYQDILQGMSMSEGFTKISNEDALFLLDILDTLRD